MLRIQQVAEFLLVTIISVGACVSAPSAPQSDMARRLKRLNRITYCGSLSVQFESPEDHSTVGTKVEVCGGSKAACERTLLAMANPVSQVDDPVFELRSCRPVEYERVKAPERRLLRKD